LFKILLVVVLVLESLKIEREEEGEDEN